MWRNRALCKDGLWKDVARIASDSAGCRSSLAKDQEWSCRRLRGRIAFLPHLFERWGTHIVRFHAASAHHARRFTRIPERASGRVELLRDRSKLRRRSRSCPHPRHAICAPAGRHEVSLTRSRLINTDLPKHALAGTCPEMMDRIAKGPEDMKKSIRDADELP
jgi:hypothetical protein